MTEAFLSLGLVWLALAVPCALAGRAGKESRAPAVAVTLARFVTALGLAWATAAVIWYALVIRRSIGSMDFYLHVCSARDLLAGPVTETSGVLASYRLFPGVFVFWRTAMRVFGPALSDLQNAYVVLLAVDSVLVALVVGRATKRVELAWFAGLWTAYLLSGLEARLGFMEPMALAPALAGTLAWGGEPLRGRGGVARAIALGAGLGLAVFMRQQAGTLAVGALALLPGLLLGDPLTRHRLCVLALVPTVAIAACALGIAIEGQGLLPLRRGLGFVHDYPGRSGLLENLVGLAPYARNALPALALGGAAGVAWLVTAARPSARASLHEPPVALAGFAAVAAAATLLPLAKRPYIHYLILTTPFAAIAALIWASRLWSRLPRGLRESGLARMTALALGAALLVSDPARPDHWGAWPCALTPANLLIPSWERVRQVSDDLARLRTLVAPGEDLLVVPPYRNEIHFLLGTRSDAYDEGYFMDMVPEGVLPHMRWERASAVVVLTAGDREWLELWKSQRCDELVAALPAHGFHETARLATMSLWRKTP